DLWPFAIWPSCRVVRTAPDSRSPSGTAILVNAKDRRVLAVQNEEIARQWVAAPGSTIKPFSLLALLENGKLKASDEYVCPGRLVLNGHSLNCSHARAALPMNVSRAIAYSCNCTVAHFAQRFRPGELTEFLVRFGFSSMTGLLSGPEAVGSVRARVEGSDCELEALGEEGVRVTPAELLCAYRRLANRAAEAHLSPIVEGLEDAVEFGTAQGARLEHTRVAGKTGSVETAPGVRVAWFAGFAPSRAPEVVATVLVQGRSGGADAAPIAGQLLRNYFGSRA